MLERVDLRERKWQFLIASIILDLISGASFGLPLIGEVGISFLTACRTSHAERSACFIWLAHYETLPFLVLQLLDLIWAPVSSYILTQMYSNRYCPILELSNANWNIRLAVLCSYSPRKASQSPIWKPHLLESCQSALPYFSEHDHILDMPVFGIEHIVVFEILCFKSPSWTRSLSRLQFWKEILPFTDILPVATITWATEYTQVGRMFAKRCEFFLQSPMGVTPSHYKSQCWTIDVVIHDSIAVPQF